ncbi:MAG: hypothetical protein LBK12_02795 [Odoribacteraceae bacterium]|jgi:hypothetical protein|nr:hypothetical protein [Odoribacteraceae bacterium]
MKMKQILIIALATFTLGSCLKSSSPAFQAVANIIFFQEIAVVDEVTSVSYVPLVQVWGNEAITTCSFTHSSLENFNLSRITDTYWRSTNPASKRTDAIPSGSFTVAATNANNVTVSSVITITTEQEGMSEKLNGELSYTPTTRDLSAKFHAVAGATGYGICLMQGEYFLADEIEVYTAAQLEAANWTITITLPAEIDNYANEYDLATYAVKVGDVPIVQLGQRVTVSK